MKKTLLFLTLFSFASFIAVESCSPGGSAGTTIEGTMQNAADLQVFVDKISIGKASSVVGKAQADANGKYAVNFSEGIEAGIYRLRFGSKNLGFILDGTEKTVSINGDHNTLQNFDVAVSGSESTSAYIGALQNLVARKWQAADIKNFVETTPNPTVGMYVAYQALGRNPQFLDNHKAALAKMDKASPYAAEYAAFVQGLEGQAASQRASGAIQVGQPAPDLKMTSPDGKEYSLSELKGKIVLLDFWASWCGPCRRENPHVVEVYDKYKSKGFTVFSVSLDGINPRMLPRLKNQAEIDQQTQRSKDRWVNAIKADNLKWEYHVSDLKHWNSLAAKTYGVRSIPRTFMVDRDGNIAAVGLRGAKAIEQELLKLL